MKLSRVLTIMLALLLVGCSPPAVEEAPPENDSVASTIVPTDVVPTEFDVAPNDEVQDENELPPLAPVELDGRLLRVVATTSVVGDVVQQVGGGLIEVTVIIGRNQAIHEYEVTPADLRALEQADVIFVNGFGLEGQLAEMIADNFAKRRVSLSVGVEPLTEGDEFDHAHGDDDPHVWFSLPNVLQWTANLEDVLSTLDPDHAPNYSAAAEGYAAALDTLHRETIERFDGIPSDQRLLVVNSDAFRYFGQAYGFRIVNAAVPAQNTSAETSAKQAAALIQTMEVYGVCTVFAEQALSSDLVERVSAELDHCDTVDVSVIHTLALGEGVADSFIGMFRQNTATISLAFE